MMGITRKSDYHMHWPNNPFYERLIFNQLTSETIHLRILIISGEKSNNW